MTQHADLQLDRQMFTLFLGHLCYEAWLKLASGRKCFTNTLKTLKDDTSQNLVPSNQKRKRLAHIQRELFQEDGRLIYVRSSYVAPLYHGDGGSVLGVWGVPGRPY